MNTSGIVPTDLNVLFYPDPVEEKTSGGIILPEQAKEKQKYATVKGTLVAIGVNAFNEWGQDAAPELGARVLTAQYAGLNIEGTDGRAYRLCNDKDIIAILKEDQ